MQKGSMSRGSTVFAVTVALSVFLVGCTTPPPSPPDIRLNYLLARFRNNAQDAQSYAKQIADAEYKRIRATYPQDVAAMDLPAVNAFLKELNTEINLQPQVARVLSSPIINGQKMKSSELESFRSFLRKNNSAHFVVGPDFSTEWKEMGDSARTRQAELQADKEKLIKAGRDAFDGAMSRFGKGDYESADKAYREAEKAYLAAVAIDPGDTNLTRSVSDCRDGITQDAVHRKLKALRDSELLNVGKIQEKFHSEASSPDKISACEVILKSAEGRVDALRREELARFITADGPAGKLSADAVLKAEAEIADLRGNGWKEHLWQLCGRERFWDAYVLATALVWQVDFAVAPQAPHKAAPLREDLKAEYVAQLPGAIDFFVEKAEDARARDRVGLALVSFRMAEEMAHYGRRAFGDKAVAEPAVSAAEDTCVRRRRDCQSALKKIITRRVIIREFDNAPLVGGKTPLSDELYRLLRDAIHAEENGFRRVWAVALASPAEASVAGDYVIAGKVAALDVEDQIVAETPREFRLLNGLVNDDTNGRQIDNPDKNLYGKTDQLYMNSRTLWVRMEQRRQMAAHLSVYASVSHQGLKTDIGAGVAGKELSRDFGADPQTLEADEALLADGDKGFRLGTTRSQWLCVGYYPPLMSPSPARANTFSDLPAMVDSAPLPKTWVVQDRIVKYASRTIAGEVLRDLESYPVLVLYWDASRTADDNQKADLLGKCLEYMFQITGVQQTVTVNQSRWLAERDLLSRKTGSLCRERWAGMLPEVAKHTEGEGMNADAVGNMVNEMPALWQKASEAVRKVLWPGN